MAISKDIHYKYEISKRLMGSYNCYTEAIYNSVSRHSLMLDKNFLS